MVNPLGFLFFVELLILKFGEEIQSLKESTAKMHENDQRSQNNTT